MCGVPIREFLVCLLAKPISCSTRSLMELGNDELDEDKADELLDNLFKNSTYDMKESLTFEDFSHVLSDYEKELNYASLSWNGKISFTYCQ